MVLQVVVLGGGSIGLYVAGCLSRSGSARDDPIAVTVVTNTDRLNEELQLSKRLLLSDMDGYRFELPMPSPRLNVLSQQKHSQKVKQQLENADVVMIAVKATQNDALADQVQSDIPVKALIISLQNGLHSSTFWKQSFPKNVVLAAMVGYNVIQKDAGHLHRCTSSPITIQHTENSALRSIKTCLELFNVPVHLSKDIVAVQHSKLLMNLTNPINALTGKPLLTSMHDRKFRLAISSLFQEGLDVYAASGISTVRVGRVVPRLIPTLMLFPNWIYLRLASSILRMDPETRTSMYYDLSKGQKTEIDDLNGFIVDLGEKHHVPTPFNSRVCSMIRQAEEKGCSPNLSFDALLKTLDMPTTPLALMDFGIAIVLISIVVVGVYMVR